MIPLFDMAHVGAFPLVGVACGLEPGGLASCYLARRCALFALRHFANDRRSLWRVGLHLQGGTGVFSKFPIPPSEWKRNGEGSACAMVCANCYRDFASAKRCAVLAAPELVVTELIKLAIPFSPATTSFAACSPNAWGVPRMLRRSTIPSGTPLPLKGVGDSLLRLHPLSLPSDKCLTVPVCERRSTLV